jgi:hypothetical protein
MYRTLVFLLIVCFCLPGARAQDTLPGFSAIVKGYGKVIISWHNSYTVVTQISVQRSPDSLKNFTTFLTVPDPRLPENGLADNKATNPEMYYRLFIVLENGKYLFTKSFKAHRDLPPARAPIAVSATPIAPGNTGLEENDTVLLRADKQRIRFVDDRGNMERPHINSPSRILTQSKLEVNKPIFIKKGDFVIGQLPGNKIRQFRDSLLTKTKDTLVFIDGDSLLIRSFVPKEVYRISAYVFTGRYGNIYVTLPDARTKHYSLKFFDDAQKPLFELKEIRDPSLILDKTNFFHAGWFRYELYEDNKLWEKNKLFIPKEF